MPTFLPPPSCSLGGLVQIPLQVAEQPRVIVDDPQQHGCLPGASTGQHLAGAMVEIQMPEGGGVLYLIAALPAVPDDHGQR